MVIDLISVEFCLLVRSNSIFDHVCGVPLMFLGYGIIKTRRTAVLNEHLFRMAGNIIM